MPQDMTIPDASMIDGTWLTEQLRASGHADATVTSVDKMAIGTGQMAKCLRLSMEVDSKDSSIPSSFVAKVKSDSEASQKMGSVLPIYRREVEFYERIKPNLSINTPRSYFSKIADDNLNFLILLEDIASAEPGNQLIGCSPEVAKKAVLELVGLHAPTWNNSQLSDPNSSMHVEPLPLDHSRQMYINTVEGFIERHGEALVSDQIDIIRKFALYEEPTFKVNKNPISIVHQDYRLDNLLITGKDDGDSEIVVVDWQTYSVGNPLNDVAYFLASSLSPEIRRNVEEDILREYHQKIIDTGVTDFSWDDCWLAYREGSLYGFTIAISSPMTVERTERGDKMFRLMADRYTRHALDLKADELFR